jgi:hypothetical protein
VRVMALLVGCAAYLGLAATICRYQIKWDFSGNLQVESVNYLDIPD